jgi:choline dehydrogenase-like flavoprotein
MTVTYDAVIIGSGFGGAFAAHALVGAGCSVLMIERGGWVPRGPEASRIDNFVVLSPYYSRQAGYRARNGTWRTRPVGALFCVGGASVFYGGVSFRFRESDFEPPPDLVGDSGAEWPIRYGDLEPFYGEAERLLGVAGDAAEDPSAPWRSTGYPAGANPLTPLSTHLAASARGLGLHPFPLPMAITFSPRDGQPACIRCGACDGWPCPVSAKNDVATRLLAPLIARGLTLHTRTAAVRLVERGGRIRSVECVELDSGRRYAVQGEHVLVAAGALATPQLLLASGLDRLNPGGSTVGRYLTRHANSIVYGRLRQEFPRDGLGKDLAILDYYDGDPHAPDAPPGPLGSLQSMPSPSPGVIATQVPPPVSWLASRLVRRVAGLLAIVPDQPDQSNGIALDRHRLDPAGLPALTITHRYSPRDRAALQALCRRARRILRGAGAVWFYHHAIRTFSHAMGTVRMGLDPRRSALDDECRFRGVANLRVVDASAFPTPGGVNPSLTIAANALRAATRLAGGFGRAAP